VPARVETTDPEGVDYGWVMQTTFVLTIVVGAAVVAVLSTGADLPTWSARATFALRVGAVVWLLTAVAVFLYARRRIRDDTEDADAQTQSET
jgi:membrane protein YdbS with pleckstrin-like domain